MSGVTVGPAPGARVMPPTHVEAVDVAFRLIVDVVDGITEIVLLFVN